MKNPPFKLTKYQQKFYNKLTANLDKNKILLIGTPTRHIPPLLHVINAATINIEDEEAKQFVDDWNKEADREIFGIKKD